MNIIKKIIIIVAVLLLMLSIISCEKEINRTTDDHISQTEEPSSGENTAQPDIIGEILEFETSDAIRVLIDSTEGDVKGEIWVTINEETSFVNEATSKEIANIDVTTFFVVGEKVSILSNGTIMESYPMQTTALCVYQSID